MPDRIVRFATSKPQALGYLIFVSISILAIAGLVWEMHARADHVEQESRERAAAVSAAGQQICDSIAEQVDVISDLIEVIVQPTPGIPASLSELPSFGNLDPEVQAFVIEIDQQGARDGNIDDRLAQFRQDRLAAATPAYCLEAEEINTP